MNPEKSKQLNQLFDQLPVGSIMELPISFLNPIIIDDWTSSHTVGDIEVYRSSKSGKINIDDGNHRYFDRKRNLLLGNNFQEPDWDTNTMRVRKIIPDIEW